MRIPGSHEAHVAVAFTAVAASAVVGIGKFVNELAPTSLSEHNKAKMQLTLQPSAIWIGHQAVNYTENQSIESPQRDPNVPNGYEVRFARIALGTNYTVDVYMKGVEQGGQKPKVVLKPSTTYKVEIKTDDVERGVHYTEDVTISSTEPAGSTDRDVWFGDVNQDRTKDGKSIITNGQKASTDYNTHVSNPADKARLGVAFNVAGYAADEAERLFVESLSS